jgi:hypothetical protein
MTHTRLVKAAFVLGLGLNLTSCGGFVADHWPHWAGGLPDGVPPRPGAPGYAEFIAHGQARPEAVPAETVDAGNDRSASATCDVGRAGRLRNAGERPFSRYQRREWRALLAASGNTGAEQIVVHRIAANIAKLPELSSPA